MRKVLFVLVMRLTGAAASGAQWVNYKTPGHTPLADRDLFEMYPENEKDCAKIK